MLCPKTYTELRRGVDRYPLSDGDSHFHPPLINFLTQQPYECAYIEEVVGSWYTNAMAGAHGQVVFLCALISVSSAAARTVRFTTILTSEPWVDGVNRSVFIGIVSVDDVVAFRLLNETTQNDSVPSHIADILRGQRVFLADVESAARRKSLIGTSYSCDFSAEATYCELSVTVDDDMVALGHIDVDGGMVSWESIDGTYMELLRISREDLIRRLEDLRRWISDVDRDADKPGTFGAKLKRRDLAKVTEPPSQLEEKLLFEADLLRRIAWPQSVTITKDTNIIERFVNGFEVFLMANNARWTKILIFMCVFGLVCLGLIHIGAHRIIAKLAKAICGVIVRGRRLP